MVTFIDDEVTVPGDQVRYFTLADEALDQCNINPAGGLPATSTNCTNGGGINRQK